MFQNFFLLNLMNIPNKQHETTHLSNPVNSFFSRPCVWSIIPRIPFAPRKFYPRLHCAPGCDQLRFHLVYNLYKHHITLSMQGNLGCLLGFQPLGQNPEEQQWVDDYRNSRILTYIFPSYRSIVLVEKKKTTMYKWESWWSNLIVSKAYFPANNMNCM